MDEEQDIAQPVIDEVTDPSTFPYDDAVEEPDFGEGEEPQEDTDDEG